MGTAEAGEMEAVSGVWPRMPRKVVLGDEGEQGEGPQREGGVPG